MSELNKKAMLVSLNISQWTGYKLDRVVTAKATSDFNAEKDAGRFNKHLLASDVLKSIQKIANEARVFHYEQTLPWGNDGSRLLPSEQYTKYSDAMRKYKRDFYAEVENFLNNYNKHVNDAKKRLGKMFRAEEYPSSQQLKHKYSFDVSVLPVPTANDFRVNLSSEDVKEIKRDILEREKKLQNDAMFDLWQRVYKVVSHMSEKLNDADAIFRDSLVNNISELCELLPALNITNDEKLEQMRKQMQKSLTVLDADELRNDKDTRKQIAKKAKKLASEIEETMQDYM